MFSKLRTNAGIALGITALVIALGAPSYAANTVNRALFAKKAGNASRVGGIKVSKTPKAGRLLPLGKNGKFPASVLPFTAASSSSRGADGATGPAGPAGPQGPAGPAGQDGAPGKDGKDAFTHLVVRTAQIGVDANKDGSGSAYCNAGESAVSGGYVWNAGPVTASRPNANVNGNPTSWYVSVHNNGQVGTFLNAYVLCAS